MKRIGVITLLCAFMAAPALADLGGSTIYFRICLAG